MENDAVPRFIAKVDNSSGCWIWRGKVRCKGYAITWFRGKNWRAHRVAWTIFRGEIPYGLQVLHDCDIRDCCNPDHLFLGNDIDNKIDMIAKGRNYSKLTADQAREIWRRYVRGSSWSKGNSKDLQAEFGVSAYTISRIANRKQWKHALPKIRNPK